MARPKIEIDLKEVEKLAGLGLTDQEIADYLGVCRKTIINNKNRNEEFLHTIKKGKLIADERVTESLYKKAINGDVTACIFWLKNRRSQDWRDKQEHEHTGKDGEPWKIIIEKI